MSGRRAATGIRAALVGEVRRRGRSLGLPSALAAGLLAGGCSGPARRGTTDARPAPVASASATQGMREQLLAGAVSILSALDRYDPQRGAEQVFDRLVQWQHAAGPASGPVPPVSELLESLPAALRDGAGDVLTRQSFDAVGDVTAIRDRCWLAAIARTARGEATGDLEVAERLFRWTIRSLAPVSDPPMVPGDAFPGSRWFLPGEILLAGRASGPQRAWIFIELLRQAGLEGVMLATPPAEGALPRPWLPAVLIDGEAYLFEPTYGLPVPGPGGRGVATARQAAADPAILEALSLPGRPYVVQAADLARGLTPLVVADPWSLAPRMAAIDRELAAAHGIRAAVDPAAVVARAQASLPGEVGRAGLWTFPWETLARRTLAGASLTAELAPLEMPVADPTGRGGGLRPLFAGRVREFRGDFEGPSGAKAAYLAARPSRRQITEAVAGLPEAQAQAITLALARMKEDATYWLGLVMLAEGQDEAAADYLGRMTLEAAPDSRWTDAARISLASALAALGRNGEAAELLRQEGSPQRYGSRLLATRLDREAAGSDGPPQREAAPIAAPERPPSETPTPP